MGAWHWDPGSVNWLFLTQPHWNGWDAQMAV